VFDYNNLLAANDDTYSETDYTNTFNAFVTYQLNKRIKTIENTNYLTGINSGLITGALGYTPYNATNPAGYITASILPTRLTQLTNDSGYITASSLPTKLSQLINDPNYATVGYVDTKVSNLVNNAPATLDTLNELATALGNDPNFATTITTLIGTKQSQLNGLGFVKFNGTSVSYDNSTYLTTGAASSTYLQLSGGTLTGALSVNSNTTTKGLTITNGSKSVNLIVDTDGKLSIDKDIYSSGEISAYGAGIGSGGSGSGLIQTVYNYASMGGSFDNNNQTDTFNAYSINAINNRLTSAVNTINTLQPISSAINTGNIGTYNFATHRGEGTDYINYSRFVYNNGAYSGSGWIEPSELGVRYAASAGNASTLGGYSYSGNPDANTIVLRNSAGYIQGSYFNSNRGDETSAAASYIYDTGDGWMRKKTLANVKSEIVTSGAVINGLGYTPYNNSSIGNASVNYSNSAGQSSYLTTSLAGTNKANLIYAQIADNDFFRLQVGGTATNAGYVEFATADDGTEPIYFRQYTGVFSSLVRTATILDENGNTSFPNTVSASRFNGSGAGLNSISTSQLSNDMGWVNSTVNRWYDGWVSGDVGGYNANTIAPSKSGFSYSNNCPYGGCLVHFDAGGYGLQLSSNYSNGNEVGFRTHNGDNGIWNSWKSFWHSGNFTPSNYQLNLGYTPINKGGDTVDGIMYFRTNKGNGTYLSNNSQYSLEAYASDGGAAAMSFHRSGYYAINMGLDPDNVFRLGGWSAPANLMQINMSGDLTMARNITAAGTITAAGVIKTNSYFKTTGSVGMAGDYDENGTTDKVIWTIGTNWASVGSMYGLGYNYNAIPGYGHSLFMANAGSKKIQFSLESGNINTNGSLVVSGSAFVGNSLSVMGNIDANVNMSINNVDSNTTLHFKDDGSDCSYISSGWGSESMDFHSIFGMNFYSNSVARMSLYSNGMNVNGNLLATGEINAYSASDKRLKNNIKSIDNSLDIINLLNPVSYNWNEKAKELNSNKTDKKDVGLIAQELKEVLPELVHTIYNDEYLSVDYIKLIPYLIGAIKDLTEKINKLESK